MLCCDHIIVMRRILLVLLVLAVSGCAIPETRWEKPGADEKMAASDLSNCRRAAQQETFQAAPLYGFGYGFGLPYWRYRPWTFYESNRFYTENRLTDFCMRNKGYQLVTIEPPRPTPPAPPPAAPAATTDK
jgi:hypothetical protein